MIPPFPTIAEMQGIPKSNPKENSLPGFIFFLKISGSLVISNSGRNYSEETSTQHSNIAFFIHFDKMKFALQFLQNRKERENLIKWLRN